MRALVLATALASGALVAGGQYSIEPSSSSFVGVLQPSGVVGNIVGNHTVSARASSGRLCIEDGRVKDAKLVVDANSLRVDTPEARRQVGQEGGRGPVSGVIEGAVKGDSGLDVDNHPSIVFVETSARSGDGGGQTLVGELTIKGVTHPVSAPITLSSAPGERVRIQGRLPVSSAAYGVDTPDIPGVLSFDDRLDLVFDATAVPTGTCD